MIRHIVLFKFRPDATADEKQTWLDLARRLPDEVDVIRALSVGEDVVHGERSFDAALVVDFDSSADVKVYVDHPSHVPLAEASRAVSSQVVMVDFEV